MRAMACWESCRHIATESGTAPSRHGHPLHPVIAKTNNDAKNIFGVVATETIHEDMKNLFNLDVKVHDKANKEGYDTSISDVGYENMRKFLWKDYQCIEKLYQLGCISRKVYDILRK